MALNDKQEKFAQSYILHRNASEAARAAGYAKNSATHLIDNKLSELETNGHTNSAIKALELLSRIRGAKSEKELTLTPEKLEQDLINSFKVLGKKKMQELMKKCGF